MCSAPFPSLPLLVRSSPTNEIRQIHALTVKTGLLLPDPSLISAKFTITALSSAQDLDNTSLFHRFDDIADPADTFVYNSLIRDHTQNHRHEEAFSLFCDVLCYCPLFLPDKYTFPAVLKSCSHLSALEEGKQVHAMILKTQEAAGDLFVMNSLIRMYSRCEEIGEARKVFDSMPQKNVVSWNSMIDGYSKSGRIGASRKVFEDMPERNVVSWNSIIAGYVQNGLPLEALHLFLHFEILGLKPDESTLVSVLSATSDLGLLNFAKTLHGYITRCRISLDGVLGAAMIHMYSKCGSIHSAFKLFEIIPNKTVGHWTSMIVGFANHGMAQSSLHLLSKMQNSGVKPNHITFIGVLSACDHAGMVEEGLKHFNLMKRIYNINPGVEHYGCLVDLLGRMGHIEEAKMIIENMPMEPGVVIWGSLLAACRRHENIEIGEFAAQKLIELDPRYGGSYVLMSDIYARQGQWDDFSRMTKLMEEKGVNGGPGLSWIEVDGFLHRFSVGDKFHPRTQGIYRTLDTIEWHLKMEQLE